VKKKNCRGGAHNKGIKLGKNTFLRSGAKTRGGRGGSGGGASFETGVLQSNYNSKGKRWQNKALKTTR